MSTNFTTPALYVRSNKYFVPLRRPACRGVCLPISSHPLFTFDQTNILYRLRRRPAQLRDMSTNFTTPALYVRSNKYFIPFAAASRPAAGYVYQFHHTRSLRSIKQIFYTVCGGVPPSCGICLPISPHPLFTFDQTNILYRL